MQYLDSNPGCYVQGKYSAVLFLQVAIFRVFIIASDIIIENDVMNRFLGFFFEVRVSLCWILLSTTVLGLHLAVLGVP